MCSTATTPVAPLIAWIRHGPPHNHSYSGTKALCTPVFNTLILWLTISLLKVDVDLPRYINLMPYSTPDC
jgi:hypothetical protein